MNLEPPFPLRSAVREDIVRPPAFEISAAPDRDVLNLFKLERAIDPSPAGPLRRRDCPIRMIIEGNKNERLTELAEPKRAQVMKIAGPVKNVRREASFEFFIKFFDDSRRRTEAKSRSPIPRIDDRQMERLASPRVVQI